MDVLKIRLTLPLLDATSQVHQFDDLMQWW